MRYRTAKDFLADHQKSVLVFGMSGVGKSFVTEVLTRGDKWRSHSIDKRIGELLKQHILRDYDASGREQVLAQLDDGDLSPLVKFLGKPGAASRGGRTLNDYRRRLNLHAQAESFALVESPSLFDVHRTEATPDLNFICDTGGSMCEVLDPTRDIRLLSAMSHRMLFVYIEAEQDYDEVLVQRFVDDPKPMYYRDDFLVEKWREYVKLKHINSSEVDPDDFAKWGFRQLLKYRRPLYEGIAKRWGVTISASEVSRISSTDDFLSLLGEAIDGRRSTNVTRNSSVGRNFADQRRSLNISKKTLADLIGMDEQTLTKIESNKAQPSERLESELYRILYLEALKKKGHKPKRRMTVGQKIVSELQSRTAQTR